MKDTVTDFWHMMWETQSKTIIMLCNLEEEGKVQNVHVGSREFTDISTTDINCIQQTCYQYWPSLTDGTAVYGDMTVKLLSEKQQEEGLIVRKLEITQEGDYINVAVSMQLQCTNLSACTLMQDQYKNKCVIT